MMMKKSVVCLTLMAAIPFALPTRVVAETDMSKFSLCRAAPADAFITVAARSNSERAFLNTYWKGVMDAFWESGVVIDMWDLITEEVPDEQLAEVEEIKERFTDLCDKVAWGELFETEMVYSGRFATLMPGKPQMYEGLVIGRMKDAETATKNYEALHAIITELSNLVEAKAGQPVFNITTESRKDGLTLAKASPVEVPFLEFNVGVRRDTIFITFGSANILTDALANLSDSREAKRMVDTPRFNAAFAKLHDAEDSIVFFDIERMMSTLRGMITTFQKEAAPAPGAPEGATPSEAVVILKVIGQLLDDVSIADHMAVVEWTDGHRVLSEQRTVLRDGASKSPIFKIVSRDRQIDNFAKYIPREATSFSVTAGFDVSAVYDYIVQFVETNVPDGKQMMGQWNGMLKAQADLDLKKDVFSLIEGTSISVSMNNESVDMIRLTDEKKAAAQFNRLVNLIKGMVPADQGLKLIPVKVGPEMELLQISHPFLMMVGMPVVGCADGHFIVGSSAGAVKKCLQTGRGKHASIKDSAPWRTEALQPETAIQSISFTNQKNMAREMQEAIAGMSMMIGLMQMGGANMPPPAQKMVSAASKIIPKMTGVAAKMNFFKSKAAYSTFDGNAWTTRSVQNYKSPAEVKALNSEDESM